MTQPMGDSLSDNPLGCANILNAEQAGRAAAGKKWQVPKKILVTGNLLRIANNKRKDESNQNINIRWLLNIISPALSRATDLELKPLHWYKNSVFKGSVLYKLQGLPVSLESLALLHECKRIHPQVLDFVNFNFQESLVIGYELPPFFIEIFDRLGIVYIDFTLHPLRFLDDLVYGVRTNHPAVYKKLITHIFNEDIAHIKAGLLRGFFSKKPSLNLKSNSSLFAGQVAYDLSLVSSGDYLDFKKVEDKFEAVLDNCHTLYFKLHPYLKPEDKSGVLRFIQKYKKKIVLTNENIYKLLCQPALQKVYALTSSVVYEAKFFSKQSEWLSKYPYSFASSGSKFRKETYIPVMQRFLYPSFWCDILQPLNICNISTNEIEYSFQPGLVRESLGMNWGLDKLS